MVPSTQEPICFDPDLDLVPKSAFKVGDTVFIPVGTPVHSTHPGRPAWVSKRLQTVKVRSTLSCFYASVSEALGEHKQKLLDRGLDLSRLQAWQDANARELYHTMVVIDPPMVRWTGAGGYWCEVDASLVKAPNEPSN
jgi:hypothetical protein